MYHRCAIKILLPKKSLKLALSRNFYFLSKQTVARPGGGCFPPHSKWSLSEDQNLWRFLPDRSLSSNKTVTSSGGQNRDPQKRQVLIMGASIVSLILFVIYANLKMEYHQDYVVIDPDVKK